MQGDIRRLDAPKVLSRLPSQVELLNGKVAISLVGEKAPEQQERLITTIPFDRVNREGVQDIFGAVIVLGSAEDTMRFTKGIFDSTVLSAASHTVNLTPELWEPNTIETKNLNLIILVGQHNPERFGIFTKVDGYMGDPQFTTVVGYSGIEISSGGSSIQRRRLESIRKVTIPPLTPRKNFFGTTFEGWAAANFPSIALISFTSEIVQRDIALSYERMVNTMRKERKINIDHLRANPRVWQPSEIDPYAILCAVRMVKGIELTPRTKTSDQDKLRPHQSREAGV